jgi:hypothetical protein
MHTQAFARSQALCTKLAQGRTYDGAHYNQHSLRMWRNAIMDKQRKKNMICVLFIADDNQSFTQKVKIITHHTKGGLYKIRAKDGSKQIIVI